VHTDGDPADDYEPDVGLSERQQQFIGLEHRAPRPAAVRS
jgi:hypothetical protein